MDPTVWQKIVQAAERGEGLQLEAEDVVLLAAESFVRTSARHDAERVRLRATMPRDEADHIDCFVRRKPGQLRVGGCDSDGWYGCYYCANRSENDEV